jgi:hypothetical protein
MLLDITPEESIELYEYIQVLLGGEDVDVDITEKEIRVLAKKALKDYLYEIQQWQTKNQFSNIVGTAATQDFTNKFVFDNTMLAQRLSDWWASMQRVGGKIPWKKDYIVLEDRRQVYNLATESSIPYTPGSRRVHRVMWVARPEIFGGHGTLNDLGLFSFGQSGLTYGNSPFQYLGQLFDVVLLSQALEMRNKVLRSEFFYNIGGDMLEVTPMPGSNSASGMGGTKLFYYYLDEKDFLGLDGQEGLMAQELIATPTQIKIKNIPYSSLNAMAKTWVDNYTIALAKYAQASKWRRVKSIASPGSEYQVEFDYSSLLEESKAEREELKLKLKEDLLAALDTPKMMEDKMNVAKNAAEINKLGGRRFFIG